MKDYSCYFCGKKFVAFPSANRKFCSSRCSGLNLKPYKRNPELNKKMSEVCKNSPRVAERLKNAVRIAAALKRGKTYEEMFGPHRTIIIKNALKIATRGESNPNWRNGEKITGDKNPNWNGGKSFEPYTVDWTITLKRSIRERDRYTCFICRKEPSLHVHHIDYDKKNCDPKNLITLCGGCHTKTNFRRDNWLSYFKIKLCL